MENYRAQLQTFTGSAEGAGKALKWITDFAAKTPYEMSDVIEGFIAAKQNALDPFSGSLVTIGNTAAAMNRTLTDTAAMLGDASRFQFERALDFGISASVKGSKVSLQYFDKANKKVVVEVKKDSEAVRAAMLSIFDQRFAGAMDVRARTTAGKFSTVMDNMKIAAARVWEGGLGASVNQQMDRFSAWLNKLENDGSLKKWADETGKGLGDFVDAVANAPWKEIAGGIRSVGGSISYLASALREFDRWKAVGVLGGYSGNGQTGGWNYHAPDWMKPRAPAPRRPVTDVPLWGDQSRPALQRQVPRRPAQAAPVKGKISLDIRTPAGTTARPTKVAASGIDVEVNTGRAMGAFA
jgi:phage tail tape-measure protein